MQIKFQKLIPFLLKVPVNPLFINSANQLVKAITLNLTFGSMQSTHLWKPYSEHIFVEPKIVLGAKSTKAWAREVLCTFLGGIANQSSPLVSYLLCNKSSPMGPTARSFVLNEERRSS